ncbi:hypothetical protein L9F63_017876, partial [Diploptera punctata]
TKFLSNMKDPDYKNLVHKMCNFDNNIKPRYVSVLIINGAVQSGKHNFWRMLLKCNDSNVSFFRTERSTHLAPFHLPCGSYTTKITQNLIYYEHGDTMKREIEELAEEALRLLQAAATCECVYELEGTANVQHDEESGDIDFDLIVRVEEIAEDQQCPVHVTVADDDSEVLTEGEGPGDGGDGPGEGGEDGEGGDGPGEGGEDGDGGEGPGEGGDDPVKAAKVEKVVMDPVKAAKMEMVVKDPVKEVMDPVKATMDDVGYNRKISPKLTKIKLYDFI